MSMRQKIIRKYGAVDLEFSVPEVIASVVIVFEVFFLIYLNLFEIRNLPDIDMAKNMRHSIEIAKHGPIIPFWRYLTSGELDNVCLFAAPLYKLLGNIYLSFGIVNILGIFAFAGIIFRLVTNLKIDKKVFLIVLLVAYSPTSLGMLGYLKSTFFGAGYYAFRFMIPLLLLSVLSTPRGKRGGFLNAFLLVICEMSIILTALSSSVFILGIAIIPLLICFAVLSLRDGIKKYNYECIVIGVTICMSLLGIVLNRVLGIHSNASGMIIKASSEGFVQDFLRSLLTLFQVIIGNSVTKDALFSISGIEYVVAVFVAIIVFGFGFSALPNVFFLRKHIDDNIGFRYETIMISMFLWSFLVNLITDTSLRYQLVGYFPLLIVSAGRMVKVYSNMESSRAKKVLGMVPSCALSIMLLCNGSLLIVNYTGQYDVIEETGKKIEKEIMDPDCSTIYFYGRSDMPEMLRLYDIDRTYLTIDTETMTPCCYDFYYDILENTEVSQKNMLIISVGDGSIQDLIPYNIAKTYKYLGIIDGFQVYYSEVNPWDGLSGLPLKGDTSTDFSYSPGYNYIAEERLLESPILESDSTYKAIITVSEDYDVSNVSCENEIAREESSLDGYRIITITFETGKGCRFLFAELTDTNQIVSIRYCKIGSLPSPQVLLTIR